MATTTEGTPTTTQHSSSPWRRTLRNAIASLLFEAGYQAAENLALETLTEMAQAYIYESGRMSKALAELASRTKVMPCDAVLALLEMGMDLTNLPGYAKRDNKTMILPPVQAPAPPPSRILQVGEKRKHPVHIPEYLPSFPDPHTYIKTPCFKQPANEYQLVREKAASQKRDVEVALTRFIAKTGATHSLFKDDTSAFPLIACKPTPLPYLAALLPMDGNLSSEDSSESESGGLHQQRTSDLSASMGEVDAQPDADTIDNPYLIPAKVAKKSWR